MKLLRTAAITLLAVTLLGCPKTPAKRSGDPPALDPAPPGDTPSTDSATTDPADGTETPGAPATPATPLLGGGSFGGLFSGDGLSLHLAQAGTTLQGTMEFRGDTFPVSARVESPGRLVGSFTSKGREFPLSATLEGVGMILKSSNKTYTLEPEQPTDPLADWVTSGTSAQLPTFRGDYLGVVEGKPASLKLLDASADLAGELTCAGHRYALEGSQGLRSATGSLQDVQRSGKRMTFELTCREVGLLDLTLTVAGDDGAQKHLMARFKRVED